MEMRKTPKCKNCGGYHYTYQCWSKKQTTTKTVTKTKKTTTSYDRQRLINELDTAVSLYVRQKGADKHGFNYCYTCGGKYHWKDMDCGHYIKRRYLQTRWDLNNVRPQCRACNRLKNGNYRVYEPRLCQELGTDFVQKMWDRALKAEKISTPMLSIMLEDIKKKYKNLQK